MAPQDLHLDLAAVRARPGVIEVLRDGAFVGILADSPHAAASAAAWARRQAKWSGGPTGDTAPVDQDPIAAIAASQGASEIVHDSGAPGQNAGTLYETTVTRPFLCHGSIGPSAAVALWQEGQVTVWTHSQGVFQLRAAIAQALRLPPERVTAIHHAGAGCYGHNGADDAAFDAVLMARAVPGRPVKVQWSRRDEFQHAPMGAAMVTQARARLSPEGRVSEMEVTVQSPPHANRPNMAGSVNLRAAAYLADPSPPLPSPDLPPRAGAARTATRCRAMPSPISG